MKITEERIQYLAGLSHIQLDEPVCAEMADELGKISSYMDVLSAVDTEGVEPLVHLFPVTNVMRLDVVTPSMDRALLLQNAPDCTEEAFVVPRTVG